MAVPNGFAEPFPMFQRAMRLVTNITNATSAQITTSFDHQYETGDIVRVYIPKGWGMHQIDRQKGTITVTSPTTFNIDINTLNFDTFVTPADPSPLIIGVPCVVPVGEINSKLTSATENVLPYT